MKPERVRAVGEAVAVVSVLLSLLFVGIELQQNRIAARAAAYQQMGIAVSDTWMATATNPQLALALNTVVTTDSTRWSELDRSDLLMVQNHLTAVLRLYETVYLQVEAGLLDEEALESLGWSGFAGSTYLKVLWPRVRGNVTPVFAGYLESRGVLSSN